MVILHKYRYHIFVFKVLLHFCYDQFLTLLYFRGSSGALPGGLHQLQPISERLRRPELHRVGFAPV